MESFIFKQQVLFRVESLCDFQPLCLVPLGGARGQNLGHLKKIILFSFIFHSWDHLYLKKYSCGDIKGKSLPALKDYWGKHCALITSMDKLSRDQVVKFRPFPYPTLSYPTTPPLSYPTLPYPYPTPSLPFPYPTPYPTPTLPYPTPYYTLPPTIPYSTLPFPTPL